MDPERVLRNLGFGGHDYSLLSRLPTRFLSSDQHDVSLVDQFYADHPEFKINEESEAMAGNDKYPTFSLQIMIKP